MILMIAGVVVSLVVPFYIYRWVKKGDESRVSGKEYRRLFLLSATLYMIPIIVIQVTFDWLLKVDHEHITTIGQCFFHAFIRASLLEEGAKFFFVRRLLKRRRDVGMKEAVLLAGIIGIGFGFLEKTMIGGGAMILNAFFPGHLLFQWVMGYYLCRALEAEGGERRKLYALSYLLPFLGHGLWDLGLFIPDVLMESENSVVVIAGAAMVFAMMVIYGLALVTGMRRVKSLWCNRGSYDTITG